jgi:hypothetical protein
MTVGMKQLSKEGRREFEGAIVVEGCVRDSARSGEKDGVCKIRKMGNPVCGIPPHSVFTSILFHFV